MNNELMHPYWITYRTKPAPGREFYTGTIRVFADNPDEATDTALRQLERKAPDYKGAIVIESVSANRPGAEE